MNIILASESPARKALLEKAGVSFSVFPAYIDEAGLIRELGITTPAEHVLALCEAKARFVCAKTNEPYIIIAADTVIYHEGKILEKPIDLDDAFNMLKNLQGKTHEVYTGVAVIVKNAVANKEHLAIPDCGAAKTFYEVSKVRFRQLEDREIIAYVKTGEALGRSGSYAINGIASLLIDGVNGDFNSVVGLPIAKVCAVLKEMGVYLLG